MARDIPYEPGDYLVEITDHDIRVPETGNPYLYLDFNVIGRMVGENAEAVDDCGVQRLFVNFDPKFPDFTKQKIAAFADCAPSQLAKDQPNSVSLVGKQYIVTCKTFANKKTGGVGKSWEPKVEGTATPASPSVLSKLDKMLGMAAKPVKPTAPTPPPVTQAPPAEVQEAVDNDVPF